MTKLLDKHRFNKGVAFCLGLALLWQAGPGAYAVETSFWAERRKQVDSQAPALSLASAHWPLARGISSMTGLGLQSAGAEAFPALSNIYPGLSPEDTQWLHTLPPSLGTLRSVQLPSRGQASKTVLFIQDVHRNPEAQGRISQAVATLAQNPATGLFALEGAFSPLDLKEFRNPESADAVRQAADGLFQKQIIAGPLHAALTTPGPIPPMMGVDDEPHYRANVEAYRRSAPEVRSLRARLQEKRSFLASQTGRVFNPELKILDDLAQAYAKNQVSLGTYANTLWKAIKDSPSLPKTTQFPQTHAFLQALAREHALDFHRVERERAQFLTTLAATLSPADLESLSAQSLAFRAGDMDSARFYTSLQSLCRTAGVNLEQTPALAEYLRYVLLAGSIQGEALLEELTQLETAAYASLATTLEEKALARTSRQLTLENKLISFSLTPGEWAHYQKLAEKDRPAENSPAFTSFEEFYRQAEARNHAMADKLLSALKRQNAPRAVLVAGGFHTGALSQLLTDQGCAVVTFTPRIEKVTGVDGSAYLSVFVQEKTPLEKLFHGEKLYLAPEVMTPKIEAALRQALESLKKRLVLGSFWPWTHFFVSRPFRGRFFSWATGLSLRKYLFLRVFERFQGEVLLSQLLSTRGLRVYHGTLKELVAIHPDLVKDYFRRRHKTFVEGKGWHELEESFRDKGAELARELGLDSDLKYQDGFEVDDLDHPTKAIYVLFVDEKSEGHPIVVSFRLLPTHENTYMIESSADQGMRDVFGEGFKPPHAEDLYEVNRFDVETSREMVKLVALGLWAIFYFSARHSRRPVSRVEAIAVLEPSLLNALKKRLSPHGLIIEPGRTQEDGTQYFSEYSTLKEGGEKIERYGGIYLWINDFEKFSSHVREQFKLTEKSNLQLLSTLPRAYLQRSMKALGGILKKGEIWIKDIPQTIAHNHDVMGVALTMLFLFMVPLSPPDKAVGLLPLISWPPTLIATGLGILPLLSPSKLWRLFLTLPLVFFLSFTPALAQLPSRENRASRSVGMEMKGENPIRRQNKPPFQEPDWLHKSTVFKDESGTAYPLKELLFLFGVDEDKLASALASKDQKRLAKEDTFSEFFENVQTSNVPLSNNDFIRQPGIQNTFQAFGHIFMEHPNGKGDVTPEALFQGLATLGIEPFQKLSEKTSSSLFSKLDDFNFPPDRQEGQYTYCDEKNLLSDLWQIVQNEGDNCLIYWGLLRHIQTWRSGYSTYQTGARRHTLERDRLYTFALSLSERYAPPPVKHGSSRNAQIEAVAENILSHSFPESVALNVGDIFLSQEKFLISLKHQRPALIEHLRGRLRNSPKNTDLLSGLLTTLGHRTEIQQPLALSIIEDGLETTYGDLVRLLEEIDVYNAQEGPNPRIQVALIPANEKVLKEKILPLESSPLGHRAWLKIGRSPVALTNKEMNVKALEKEFQEWRPAEGARHLMIKGRYITAPPFAQKNASLSAALRQALASLEMENPLSIRHLSYFLEIIALTRVGA